MTAPEQQNLKVLLVEDYEINQKVALRMLQKLGVTADLAQNGAEACEAAAAKDYDLILMDCEMPILNGFDATAKIRASEVESGIHHTIIAMTAHYGPDEERRCIEAGMNGFIEKPIRMDILDQTLRDIQPR